MITELRGHARQLQKTPVGFWIPSVASVGRGHPPSGSSLLPMSYAHYSAVLALGGLLVTAGLPPPPEPTSSSRRTLPPAGLNVPVLLGPLPYAQSDRSLKPSFQDVPLKLKGNIGFEIRLMTISVSEFQAN